jgi:hypothetical protein
MPTMSGQRKIFTLGIIISIVGIFFLLASPLELRSNPVVLSTYGGLTILIITVLILRNNKKADSKSYQKIVNRSSPNDSENKGTIDLTYVSLGLVVISSIILLVLGFQSGFLNNVSTYKTDNLETWSQWGMRIDHPYGIETQYSGVWENDASEQSGTVDWMWNKGDTILTISWISSNLDVFDYDGIMNSMIKSLDEITTEISEIEKGEIIIDERVWKYESIKYTMDGVEGYGTYAICLYEDRNRVYNITFVDTKPDTLNSMKQFVDAFKG